MTTAAARRQRRLVRPSPYKSSMIFNLTLAALSLLSRPLARSRTPRDRLRIIRPRGEKEAHVILGPGKDISTAADGGHQIRNQHLVVFYTSYRRHFSIEG